MSNMGAYNQVAYKTVICQSKGTLCHKLADEAVHIFIPMLLL